MKTMRKRYIAGAIGLLLALTVYTERSAIMLKILPGALDGIMTAQPLA